LIYLYYDFNQKLFVKYFMLWVSADRSIFWPSKYFGPLRRAMHRTASRSATSQSPSGRSPGYGGDSRPDGCIRFSNGSVHWDRSLPLTYVQDTEFWRRRIQKEGYGVTEALSRPQTARPAESREHLQGRPQSRSAAGSIFVTTPRPATAAPAKSPRQPVAEPAARRSSHYLSSTVPNSTFGRSMYGREVESVPIGTHSSQSLLKAHDRQELPPWCLYHRRH